MDDPPSGPATNGTDDAPSTPRRVPGLVSVVAGQLELERIGSTTSGFVLKGNSSRTVGSRQARVRDCTDTQDDAILAMIGDPVAGESADESDGGNIANHIASQHAVKVEFETPEEPQSPADGVDDDGDDENQFAQEVDSEVAEKRARNIRILEKRGMEALSDRDLALFVAGKRPDEGRYGHWDPFTVWEHPGNNRRRSFWTHRSYP